MLSTLLFKSPEKNQELGLQEAGKETKDVIFYPEWFGILIEKAYSITSFQAKSSCKGTTIKDKIKYQSADASI